MSICQVLGADREAGKVAHGVHNDVGVLALVDGEASFV